jgi:hypothetical protein
MCRRKWVFVAVFLLFVVPLPSVAASRARPQNPPGLLVAIWQRLCEAVPALGLLVKDDGGGSMDPDGAPAPLPRPQGGGTMDPDG